MMVDHIRDLILRVGKAHLIIVVNKDQAAVVVQRNGNAVVVDDAIGKAFIKRHQKPVIAFQLAALHVNLALNLLSLCRSERRCIGQFQQILQVDDRLDILLHRE